LVDREQIKKEDDEWMRTKLVPKDDDWVAAASPPFSPSKMKAESRSAEEEEEEELGSQKATQKCSTADENSKKKMGYSSSNDSALERNSKRRRTEDSFTKKQRAFQSDDWMAAGKKYKDLAQELSRDKQGNAPILCALYYAASALSYLRSMVDNEVSSFLGVPLLQNQFTDKFKYIRTGSRFTIRFKGFWSIPSHTLEKSRY
jgi:hypothetical protein